MKALYPLRSICLIFRYFPLKTVHLCYFCTMCQLLCQYLKKNHHVKKHIPHIYNCVQKFLSGLTLFQVSVLFQDLPYCSVRNIFNVRFLSKHMHTCTITNSTHWSDKSIPDMSFMSVFSLLAI